jgi:hypothetical protein
VSADDSAPDEDWAGTIVYSLFVDNGWGQMSFGSHKYVYLYSKMLVAKVIDQAKIRTQTLSQDIGPLKYRAVQQF